jgi:bifunctional enzyme CysN/CysC
VRENLNLVVVGHVDHGKSTVIGRLLADTGSLPEGKLEQVKERCRRNSKPFEYAFLLDALKDEQSQGITIDSARCFFKTEKRNYIIIDAPGHIEFLKNMITGASRADAALLVIDAKEGIQENSRRHGYILSMLGIKQLAVLVNKMDLVDYSEIIFKDITKKYSRFLEKINVIPACFIPVSAMKGDNIASHSRNMKWFKGPDTLEILDEFMVAKLPRDMPFRMPVQDVYKFTNNNDNRRIVAGTVESGVLNTGNRVVFYPSGKTTTVKTIEEFNRPKPDSVSAGYATGFTLTEQVYIKRGELVAVWGQKKPHVTTRFRVSLFWLGKVPMEQGKTYYIKIGTMEKMVEIENILNIIDASSLDMTEKNCIEKHDIAECILKTKHPVAFDLAADIVSTGRFVIVDGYEITGGGIIKEALEDSQSQVREKVFLREYKWEQSSITNEERIQKYNQKPTLIIITGESDSPRKEVARTLEKKLFNEGRIVYFLGIGNVLYGVDADIKSASDNRKKEHIRRLAEVANIILDAGVILVVTAAELSRFDEEVLKTVVAPENILMVWLGENLSEGVTPELIIKEFGCIDASSRIISDFLTKNS